MGQPADMGEEPTSLASALRTLWRAAGSPKQTAIAKQTALSNRKLSDWLNGRHTARDFDELWRLVQVLSQRARVSPEETTWRRLLVASHHETPTATEPRSGNDGELSGPLARDAVSDLASLGVHNAIDLGAGPSSSPTTYVQRSHDVRLRRTLLDPQTRLVVVVGESCTGKTRAAAEAVAECKPDWLLMRPQDAAELSRWLRDGTLGDGNRPTVLWLDEIYQFLHDDVGEQVAAALKSVLRRRTETTIVGTLWPVHWTTLTAVPEPSSTDRDEHVHARHLLRIADPPILVPNHFEGDALRRMQEVAAQDPRVKAAVDAAGEDGDVIQHLTGGPELVARYQNPGFFTPTEWAVITAALDASRLGFSGPIPTSFLEQAASGYLNNKERVASDNWLPNALSRICTLKVKGAISALEPSRIRPDLGEADSYRPADYLDQHARDARQECPPPATFWEAVATHAEDPNILSSMAYAAKSRGFHRHAARLFWAAAQAGHPYAQSYLLSMLVDAGRRNEAKTLAHDIAARVDTIPLDQPMVLWELPHQMAWLGYQSAADILMQRLVTETPISRMRDLAFMPAMSVYQHSPSAQDAFTKHLSDHINDMAAGDETVMLWVSELQRRGKTAAAGELAFRVAMATPAATQRAVREAEWLRKLSLDQATAALTRRIIDSIDSFALDWPPTINELFKLLSSSQEADHAIAALSARIAASAERLAIADSPREAANHLTMLHAVGEVEAANALTRRIESSLGSIVLVDTPAVCALLSSLDAVGNGSVATRLADLVAAHAPIRSASDLIMLVAHLGSLKGMFKGPNALEGARHPEAARALIMRAADLLEAMPLTDAVQTARRSMTMFAVVDRLRAVAQVIHRLTLQVDELTLDEPQPIADALDLLDLGRRNDVSRRLAERAVLGVRVIRKSRDDRRRRESLDRLGHRLEAVGVADARLTLARRGADAGQRWGTEWMADLLRESGRDSDARNLSRFGRTEGMVISEPWTLDQLQTATQQ